MFISDFYKQKKPVVSFEVFPPKKDADIENIYSRLATMTALNPDFISVTYGAGGSAQSAKTTRDIACTIKQSGTEALAHLTCVGADRDSIRAFCADLKSADIHNIMALRGDLPEGMTSASTAFRYASDLIAEIKAQGDFCIGAACYPETHIECDDSYRDLVHLRRKQEAGADFLITQLFFDNDVFYRFLEQAHKVGVTLPVSAGVMPILFRGQIERAVFNNGVSLPTAIIRLLHKYENDPVSLRRAGMEHAVNQMEQLIRGGADGVHIYVMNRPTVAKMAMERCLSLGLRY